MRSHGAHPSQWVRRALPGGALPRCTGDSGVLLRGEVLIASGVRPLRRASAMRCLAVEPSGRGEGGSVPTHGLRSSSVACPRSSLAGHERLDLLPSCRYP